MKPWHAVKEMFRRPEPEVPYAVSPADGGILVLQESTIVTVLRGAQVEMAEANLGAEWDL